MLKDDRLEEAERVLRGFLKFPAGWDSYGGKRIDSEKASAALAVLKTLWPADASLPDLIPCPTGGVQLEWTSLGGEIELEAISATEFEFLFTAVDGESFGGKVSLVCLESSGVGAKP
jgi:hypothetical protein